VNPDSGALGIGQWLGSRKAELQRRYGPNPTLGQQLDFLAYELRGGDHGGKAVLAQGDEAAVLDAYIRKFMRPAAGKETSGDLSRGMAALGRDGELPARAEVAEAAPDWRPEMEVREAELAREREAIDADQLTLTREAGAIEPDERSPLPELRRDLFPDEEGWRVAQEAVDAERYEPRRGEAEPSVTAYVDDYIAGRWREQGAPAEVEQFAANNAAEIEAEFQRRADTGASPAPESIPEDIPGEPVVVRAGEEAPAPAARAARKPTAKAAGNPHVANGDQVTFREPVGYLGGEPGDTYTVESAGRREAYFRNDRTGAGSSLPTWQIKRALADKHLEVRRADEPGEAARAPERDAAAEVEPMPDAVAQRFDDPAGSEASAQAEGLLHDLRSAADAGKLDGVNLGEGESAKLALARLDEEQAALDAIRGCL
jgi:hypothetical protein